MEDLKTLSQAQRKKFNELLKDLTSYELYTLSERIVTMMALTINDIKENPERYKNDFKPHVYRGLAEKVHKHL